MGREYPRVVLEEFGSADITFQADHVDPLSPAPEPEIGLNDDAVFTGGKQGQVFKPADFFDDPVAGEEPVMKEDLTLVAVESLQFFAELESKMKNLNHLLARVHNEGGMSVSIAVEARQMFPEFDKGTHLGYYTEIPSATRKAVAMEALNKSMWSLILAAFVAISAMIYKLYRWFTGKDKATPADAVNVATARVETIKNVSEAFKLVEKTTAEVEEEARKEHLKVNVAEDGAPEQLVPVLKYDQIIEQFVRENSVFEYAKDTLYGGHPYLNDITSRGPYTRIYCEVGGQLDLMVSDIESRTQMALDVINTLVSDKRITTEHAQKKIIAELMKEPTYNIEGGKRTLRELVTMMNEARSKAAASTNKPRLLFSDLVSKVNAVVSSHEVIRAMETEVTVYKQIDEVRSKAEAMSRFLGDEQDQSYSVAPAKSLRYTLNHDVGPTMIRCIINMRSDLSSFEMLLQACHQFEYQLEHSYRACFAIAKKLNHRLYMRFIKDNEDPSPIVLHRLNILLEMNTYFGKILTLRDKESWYDSRRGTENFNKEIQKFEQQLRDLK